MNTTTTNGKPRKQLSDQLDRFDEQLQRADAVLDALADGLNAAVADAAREGVRQAVKEAVIEVLTNADLRMALHRANVPVATTAPECAAHEPLCGTRIWVLVFGRAARAARSLAAAAAAIAKAVADPVRTATTVAATASRRVRLVCPLWVLVVVGTAAGTVLATASYLAPHAISAALTGLNGGILAAAVRISLGLRRAVRGREAG